MKRTYPTGKDHPNWKGGITKNQDGYLAFSAGPHRKKYVHRVYMEKLIGRPLRPDEEVDHLCKNRACWPPTDFHLCLMPAVLHHSISCTNRNKQYWRKKKATREENPDSLSR